MLLIIGLGNPGKKYEKTRHNIGSRIIDELKSFNLENVVLAKPQTFMNESGKGVKNLLKNHRLKPDNLIIIHDDIDILLDKIRIIKNRGSAGHKGVESIIKELKTKDFIRIRVGIKPKMESASWRTKNPEKFVLQKFNKDEDKIIKEAIKKTAEAVETVIREGLEKTMSKYNK